MITQEAIADLERVKAELAQSIQRKEREFGAVMAKIEDEGSLGTKQQKQIKELSVSNKFYDLSRYFWILKRTLGPLLTLASKLKN